MSGGKSRLSGGWADHALPTGVGRTLDQYRSMHAFIVASPPSLTGVTYN